MGKEKMMEPEAAKATKAMSPVVEGALRAVQVALMCAPVYYKIRYDVEHDPDTGEIFVVLEYRQSDGKAGGRSRFGVNPELVYRLRSKLIGQIHERIKGLVEQIVHDELTEALSRRG